MHRLGQPNEWTQTAREDVVTMTDPYTSEGYKIFPEAYRYATDWFRSDAIGKIKIGTAVDGRSKEPSFQTIISGDDIPGYRKLCSGYADAIAQHERAVEIVAMQYIRDRFLDDVGAAAKP
jgi:hypothetical protein